MERLEELESLIGQLETKLEKAMAGGSDREINTLKKDIKKFTTERDAILDKENQCSCAVK